MNGLSDHERWELDEKIDAYRDSEEASDERLECRVRLIAYVDRLLADARWRK